MNLGYLVPEFPGQTHVMFWRELTELRKRGVCVDVVSTRHPRSGGVHDWSSGARAEATYLFPPKLSLVVGAIGAAILAGPSGIARWCRTLRASEGVQTARGAGRLLGLAVSGAMLAGLARRRHWTHLHVHSCGDAANIALFAARLSRLTYSITLHGGLDDYGGNQLLKWQHASFAIVITKALQAEVEQSKFASTKTSLRVVGMGVDPAVFRRATAYRPWQPGERARLFSCGRLNQAKGHLDTLRALQLIRASGIDAVLVIAGEDELGGLGYRRTIEEFIADASLSDVVELLGAVTEDRIRRELDLAHVFVLASHAEPLGVAIMEAMAMETPVVVTGAGGVGELVDDRISGILVPPSSPEHIARAVTELLAKADLASRIGSGGRATVVDRFSSARSAEVLLDELGKLVGSARTPNK